MFTLTRRYPLLGTAGGVVVMLFGLSHLAAGIDRRGVLLILAGAAIVVVGCWGILKTGREKDPHATDESARRRS